MTVPRRWIALAAGLCIAGAARFGEDPVFAKAGIPSHYSPGQMDPRVPAPEKVLGFKIGERFVTHADVLAYSRAVAAAAPERVRLETYGKTPEGRELILLVVSAPENHANMEALAGEARALWAPRPGERRALSPTHPVFVWFSYGVHGDEASSPDAAMATSTTSRPRGRPRLSAGSS